MRDDDPLRRASLGARPTFDEHDDRAQHGQRRAEVALVHAQLAAAEADHHVAVARQSTALDASEPELLQELEEVIGVSRWGDVERELELRWIAIAAEEPSQRAKHLTGPETKPLAAAFQTSVDTSIFSCVMLMLLTDDGRPPRIRLETVPAVEITVPFLVCSM